MEGEFPFWPHRSRSIHRLQLYADEVFHSSVGIGRNQKVIDTSTWYSNLRNKVQLVSRLVRSKQVQTIDEYLFALK